MSSMTEDTTYNGWKNYPTWNVNLWLSNDEPLYREALERAAGIVNAAPDYAQVTEGIWTVEQAQRFILADDLRSWVRDELTPDLGPSFAGDLLGYALDEVDWYEIADAWLETLSEQD